MQALTVLLVEDDNRERRLLKATIEKLGHHVTEARNLSEALLALRKHCFDTVITDNNMGNHDDGIQVLQFIDAARHKPYRVLLHSHDETTTVDKQKVQLIEIIPEAFPFAEFALKEWDGHALPAFLARVAAMKAGTST